MTKSILLGTLRHALTVAGGALLMQHGFTEADVETIAGAVMTIIAVAWSAIDKVPGTPPVS